MSAARADYPTPRPWAPEIGPLVRVREHWALLAGVLVVFGVLLLVVDLVLSRYLAVLLIGTPLMTLGLGALTYWVQRPYVEDLLRAGQPVPPTVPVVRRPDLGRALWTMVAFVGGLAAALLTTQALLDFPPSSSPGVLFGPALGMALNVRMIRRWEREKGMEVLSRSARLRLRSGFYLRPVSATRAPAGWNGEAQ